MYPEIVPIEGNIELVQNSGIQFVDYEVLLNWKNKDSQSVIRTLDPGYFVRFAASQDEPLVRLVPRISSDVIYIDPFNNRMVSTQDASYTVSLKQSLELFDGVWFPIPYLPEHLTGQYGPINWARARIVKVTDPKLIAEAKAREALNSLGSESIEEADDYSPLDAGLAGAAAGASEGLDPKAAANADGSSASAAGAGGGIGGTTSGRGRSDEAYYRIVLAFDTHTQTYNENYGYLAPTERDVESGVRFVFAYTADRCQDFLKPIGSGLPWVREWSESVFRDLFKERCKPRIQEEELEQLIVREHQPEAHYLNLLAFLGFMVKPAKVHFISNQATASYNSGISNSKVVDVSLILDIGNSRTCGIMVEDHPNVTRGDDDFSDTYVLTLRDLNTPEQIYNQPFASRIEFAKPNFDYDNRSARSSRPDAFNWPSMVRVGTEAQNLAAHREGNEGSSGLSSPKRYLWNTDRLVNDRWVFNTYSYQIDSKKLQIQQKEQVQRAFLNSVGCYFNTDGKAYFALDADENVFDNLESCYSNRSTMTFMLIEILLHAMTQMNSVAQRNQCTSKDAPRRLKAIILTTPPGMPAEEKELYRACVYEALGILWKSLGFDKSSPKEFQFKRKTTASNYDPSKPQANEIMEEVPEISPAVPEVYMDWNEAEAGQVVYIYNESQKTYQGDCQAFIRYLRREQKGLRLGEVLEDAEGNALLSARIASLDIGGGTTDLVIKDYSFKRDVPPYGADIIPHEVVRDGSKLAGDDIVHDLIKECIMTRLALVLARHRVNFKPVLQQLVGESTTGNIRQEVLRVLFTQQILVQLAYKLLFHLEHLDIYETTCVVSGTVRDFLMDTESNDTLPPTVKRPGPCKMPSAEVVGYADSILGQYLKGFSIMDFKMSFDLVQINQAMISGLKFNLFRILNKFGEVITAFNCDLLLLTGRSSKLPGIRQFFMQRLNLPSTRIIAMHAYRCESWYPFKHEGEFIGDPKTTASVGALISYLRLSHNKFPNFRFYSYPEEGKNNAHYVGIIDNSNMISDDAVLYKYESARMLAKMHQSDEDDEEANFVPYKREDEHFSTQLSLELGYRLLDDPNFEATPLYKIEAYNSVDDIKKVKKALSLSYDNLSRESLMKLVDQMDFELQDSARTQISQYLDSIDLLPQQGEAYKQQLQAQLQQTITQEGLVAIPEPTGLFAGGKKKKADAERQAWMAAQYQERYNAEVLELAEQYITNQRFELENQLTTVVNDLLEQNIKILRQRFSRGYETLMQKLNVQREHFDVTLKVVNRHSPYPVAFIKRNLPNLKQVETFELERVESQDGTDYTPYFKMYLKTISGAKVKYFMDSGAIDLNGINPRFIL